MLRYCTKPVPGSLWSPAHDLYVKYLESDGKDAHFNPSALIYSLGNALETLGEREGNEDLADYAGNLKKALKDTVADGIITADLRGKTSDPGSLSYFVSDVFIVDPGCCFDQENSAGDC